MKHIAVFENDYATVNGVFDTVNILLSGELKVHLFTTLNDASINDSMSNEHIFVDIDLSKTNKITGYDVIKALLGKNYPLEKISIITGHHVMKTELIDNGIPENIKVFNKPLGVLKIHQLLK